MYLLDGVNYTKGQGGMYHNHPGIYKLNISNIAVSTVTIQYWILSVSRYCTNVSPHGCSTVIYVGLIQATAEGVSNGYSRLVPIDDSMKIRELFVKLVIKTWEHRIKMYNCSFSYNITISTIHICQLTCDKLYMLILFKSTLLSSVYSNFLVTMVFDMMASLTIIEI